MQCQYRSYAELVGFLQKKKKLFTRVTVSLYPIQNLYAHNMQHFKYKWQFHLNVEFTSIKEKK